MTKVRDRKLKMLEKYRVCFWCGIPVKDYGMIPIGKLAPDDMATIDHLVSRFFRRKGENVNKVLSCYKCNHDRCIKEDRKYGTGVTRSYPQPMVCNSL